MRRSTLDREYRTCVRIAAHQARGVLPSSRCRFERPRGFQRIVLESVGLLVEVGTRDRRRSHLLQLMQITSQGRL